ncbi:MAG: hypothetical protein JOZ47_23580 [Kutzneria sp.]|nr:hypothetical protein [Kutzneria sp.]
MSLDLITAANAVVAGALWIGAANKALQVWRAPEDRPLRAVTATVLGMALEFTVRLSPVGVAVDAVCGPGTAGLVANLSALMCTYCLLAFFLYAAHDAGGDRQVRLQLVPLVLTMVTLILAFATATPRVRAHPTDLSLGPQPAAAVYELSVAAYLCYSIGTILRWSVVCMKVTEQRRLRRSLALISAAFALALVASVLRTFVTVMTWIGAAGLDAVRVATSLTAPLVLAGGLLFVVGISYPAAAGMVATIPVWWSHRRDFTALYPLWRALHDAFPDLQLPTTRYRRWRRLAWLTRTHRGYYRRVIEIKDGLVQLAAYCSPDDSPAGDAAGYARLVRNAIDAKAAGRAAVSPHPLASRGGQDLNSDARWLVAVSHAFATAAGAPPAGTRRIRAERRFPSPDSAFVHRPWAGR